MSNSSGVITLKPVKGSELMKQHADSPVQTVGSRYTPPSKRGEEVKVIKPLTVEQLDSQTNFPSLPSTGSMTKAASWGQLRARLATPQPDEVPSAVVDPQLQNSMKSVIEDSLKRSEIAAAVAQRNEAITDPFLMSRDKAQREGWEILNLRMKEDEKRLWFNRSSYNLQEHIEEAYAWPAPIMNFSVDKVQKLLTEPQRL